MTTYDAGRARAIYELSAEQALRTQQALLRGYEQLAKAAAIKPPPLAAAPRPAGASGAQSNNPANSDRAILAQANAMARLAQVQNTGANAARGLAQAENILQDALGKVDQSSLAAIRTQTQLAAVQNRLKAQAGGGLPVLPRTVESFGTEAIGQLKSGILGLVGPAAIASAAIAAIPAAINLSQTSAKIDATRQSFDSLAKSVNTTGDALLGKLRQAAAGTVSDAELIQSANSGILLTGGKLASDLPKLLQIARASAQATGDDVGFVFDSLVKGIARGSPQIIDNAKITLDAEGAFRTYAASIGKSTDELTRAEQQQATLNAVMAAGNDIIAKTGGALDTRATRFARLGTVLENTKNSLGSILGSGIDAQIVKPILDFADGVDRASAAYTRLITPAADATQAQQAAVTATEAYNRAIAGGSTAVQAAAAYQAAYAKALKDAAASADLYAAAAGGAYRANLAAIQAAAQAAALQQQVTQAQLGYANALEQSGIQQRAAALAAQQKSVADKLAAIDAQTHGIAEQKLSDQAKSAADALLRAGPAGARTAALLANSSQDVDVLTAAYYRLGTATLAAARDALNANIAAGAAGRNTGRQFLGGITNALTSGAGGGIAGVLGGGAGGVFREVDAQQRALNDSATQLALARAKTDKDRIAILQGQLDKTLDQTERNRILAQIEGLRNTTAKAHTSELDKQLTLNERIRDSIQDQAKAALDLQKSRAQDTLDRLKEQQEAAKAQRILNNPNARADLREAARARLDIIDADQKLRQLDIAEKAATVGGTIVNGRVLQSVPGGRVPAGGVPPGPVPTPTGAPSVSLPQAGGQTITLQLVDTAGQVIARTVEPFIVGNLRVAFAQSQSGGA